MLELGIFCVILLAAAYWATLWVMGRRDDVLHGKFVQPEPGLEVPRQAAPLLSARAPLPRRVARPANTQAKRVNSEALQSLLAAIQKDLKDVA